MASQPDFQTRVATAPPTLVLESPRKRRESKARAHVLVRKQSVSEVPFPDLPCHSKTRANGECLRVAGEHDGRHGGHGGGRSILLPGRHVRDGAAGSLRDSGSLPLWASGRSSRNLQDAPGSKREPVQGKARSGLGHGAFHPRCLPRGDGSALQRAGGVHPQLYLLRGKLHVRTGCVLRMPSSRRVGEWIEHGALRSPSSGSPVARDGPSSGIALFRRF